jgi:hypothetical protein
MTSIQGQAIMDQIKYGGNAGLKSLFITGTIVGAGGPAFDLLDGAYKAGAPFFA